MIFVILSQKSNLSKKIDKILIMNELYSLEKRDKKEKRLSSDGSFTLYSSEFDECYHSLKDGALAESLKKHIEIAFEIQADKKSLNILDICFGLGYNTLATLFFIRAKGLDKRVNIISPEFDEKLVSSLKDFPYPKEFDEFEEIIKSISQSGLYQDKTKSIKVIFDDARVALRNIKNKIDIVYQDPFSPKKNPLLWTREYFETIYKISSDDMIMTTYSVATAVRLGMWESGFFVYEYQQDNLRKGTIASKKELEGFKMVDMELKLKRNPQAKSLRDRDFLES